MQYDHGIALELGNAVLKLIEQNVVVGLALRKKCRTLKLRKYLGWDPVTGAFASGLVLAPEDVEPGALQNIEQIFTRRSSTRLERIAAQP